MTTVVAILAPFLLILMALHFGSVAWDQHKRKVFQPFEISSSEAVHYRRVCSLEGNVQSSVVGCGGRVDTVMGMIEDGDMCVIFPKGTRGFRVATDQVEYQMPSGDTIVMFENSSGRSRMWLKRKLKKTAKAA